MFTPPGSRRHRYLWFFVLPGVFAPLANAQTRKTVPLFKGSCEQIEPLATGLLGKNGLVLHKTTDCNHCFAGDTEHLRDPYGKAVSATTAFRKYIDRKNLPHSNPVVWYTERELHTSAKLKFLPSEGTCRVDIAFDYSFYGIQLVTLLPVDGDRVHGDSNARLETEYLDRLKDLSSGVTKP